MPRKKVKPDAVDQHAIDQWDTIRQKNYADLDADDLEALCRDKGVILWEDEVQDLDKLIEACRERDIELVEDLPPINPHDPIVILAAEAAFNPRFTDAADALRRLREEFKRAGVYDRATLDMRNLCR